MRFVFTLFVLVCGISVSALPLLDPLGFNLGTPANLALCAAGGLVTFFLTRGAVRWALRDEIEVYLSIERDGERTSILIGRIDRCEFSSTMLKTLILHLASVLTEAEYRHAVRSIDRMYGSGLCTSELTTSIRRGTWSTVHILSHPD